MKENISNKLENHVFILNHVCAEFNITSAQLFEKTRKREIMYARKIFYYLCKKHTRYTLEAMGLVGYFHSSIKQDHATVLHAINTCEDVINQDEYLRKSKASIELKIYTLLNLNPNLIMIKEDIKTSIDRSKDIKSLIKLLQFQTTKLQENEPDN